MVCFKYFFKMWGILDNILARLAIPTKVRLFPNLLESLPTTPLWESKLYWSKWTQDMEHNIMGQVGKIEKSWIGR